METDSQEIISSFVDKYGLTRGQVIAEIEKTFSSMLSRWHGKDVVVLFTGNRLQALAYHRTPSGVVQVPVELDTMRGWNTIQRILDKNLSRAACLQEVAALKKKEHQVFWGEIVRKNEKCLLVEIETEPGVVMVATCLASHIGRHERDAISVGQRRAFHLRRVDPVDLNGTPRVGILVDRISKNLVERLLVNGSKAKIRCLKRYVGKKSFVETDRFLPKKLILDVSKELGEHIQVKVKPQ